MISIIGKALRKSLEALSCSSPSPAIDRPPTPAELRAERRSPAEGSSHSEECTSPPEDDLMRTRRYEEEVDTPALAWERGLKLMEMPAFNSQGSLTSFDPMLSCDYIDMNAFNAYGRIYELARISGTLNESQIPRSQRTGTQSQQGHHTHT